MTKQHQTAATSASTGFALPVRIAQQPNPTPPDDRAPIAFLAGAIAGAAGLFALGAYLGRHACVDGPCLDDMPPGPAFDADADDPFSHHYGPFYDDFDADDEHGD